MEDGRIMLLTDLLEGNEPKYKITQAGDPTRQREMKATLPNRHTAYKIAEMREIYDPNPLAYEIRPMYQFLFDHEMGLGMGG